MYWEFGLNLGREYNWYERMWECEFFVVGKVELS